jgi:hypothetical protein
MTHYPTLQDRIAMETVQTPPQQPPPGQPQQPQQPPPAAPQQTPGPGPAPTPPGPVQPTAPGPAPNAQAYVQIPAEELRGLLADRQVAEQARQAEAQRAAKAEADRLKAIADKDGVEAALRLAKEQQQTKEQEYQQEVARFKGRLLDYHKRTELGRGLLGVAWMSPEAARDAEAKLMAQFESVDVGGQVITRQIGTGKGPAEAIPELLKSTEYAHFLQASTQGGAGASGTHRPGTPPSDDPAARIEAQLRASIRRQVGDSIGLRGEYMPSSKN